MRFSPVRSVVRFIALLVLSLATSVPAVASTAMVVSSPAIVPLVSEWEFLSGSVVQPSKAACNAVGRRCFTPNAMHNSYNYASLLAAGNQGQGKTVAIVDSFGSDTIR